MTARWDKCLCPTERLRQFLAIFTAENAIQSWKICCFLLFDMLGQGFHNGLQRRDEVWGACFQFLKDMEPVLNLRDVLD
jgi:hypothetical protein